MLWFAASISDYRLPSDIISAKVDFLYGIMKIKQFYSSSNSQIFQKKQMGTKIWEGSNILSSGTYIGSVLAFVEN